MVLYGIWGIGYKSVIASPFIRHYLHTGVETCLKGCASTCKSYPKGTSSKLYEYHIQY